MFYDVCSIRSPQLPAYICDYHHSLQILTVSICSYILNIIANTRSLCELLPDASKKIRLIMEHLIHCLIPGGGGIFFLSLISLFHYIG